MKYIVIYTNLDGVLLKEEFTDERDAKEFVTASGNPSYIVPTSIDDPIARYYD